MTSDRIEMECLKIDAISTLEEVGEMTGMLLDDGEISRTDFPYPRIYLMVRAIDRLVRGQVRELNERDAAMLERASTESAQ